MATPKREYSFIQLEQNATKIVRLCFAFLTIGIYGGCGDLTMQDMLQPTQIEPVEIPSPKNDVVVITEKFGQVKMRITENNAIEAYQLLFSIYDVDFRKWQQPLHQQNATETIKIELQFGQILEKLKGDIEPDKTQNDLKSSMQLLMLALTTQMASLPEPEISVPEQPKPEERKEEATPQ